MRKVSFLILLIGLAVLVGGWWVYQRSTTSKPSNVNGESATGGPGKNPGGQPAGGQLVPAVAATVAKKDVPIYFNGIGTVQAYNTVTVNSRVTGQIMQIAFKEGQDVKQGDLLAVVDPRPYQTTLDQAVAKKAQDVAQLANARVVFQRDGDLLAKKVLDQQTYDTQKFLVDQYNALVKADDANIEAARVNLDYCHITSPIDGRTGIRLVDQGNIIQAGSSSAICNVTQLKPISILFTLPQQQLQKVNEEFAKGALKVFAVDTSNTKTLSEGTLAVVNNQIDSTTGTVQLKATFANKDLKLWPGEFVNARLLVTKKKMG